MSVHIHGIRHHGPGSARSLLEALEALQPDAILIEGPPDAAEVIDLAMHPEMRPPVALLLHVQQEPERAVFYPFAVFSPEWQALRYGLANRLAVRLIDLPQAHRFALESNSPDHKSQIRDDPLQALAEVAGFTDGERWWERLVEERRHSAELFQAISEMMAALRDSARDSATEPENQIEALREAWMRQAIRLAKRDGYERIAVVCGAWHAPVLNVDLDTIPSAKEDAALLKGLPKVKIESTWIPWTNGRLSYQSGYGAGIQSPGWYHHLWTAHDQVTIRWMSHVAQLLREEDLDVSSAHVIEAVRLAETLAILRGQSMPGLGELNDAVQTVLCFGHDLPLQLIHQRLIVGETIGEVPEETPTAPLQRDLQREQKRLRLPVQASDRDLDLDLRKATDLDRSRLLHRLNLLGVCWGKLQDVSGKSSTFHEIWRLRWQPEFSIVLIEAGVWGKTIVEAASAYARHAADRAETLPALTELLDQTLLADLPDAVTHLMSHLQSVAAVASDVSHLMAALPPLANVMRYGNVRQTNTTMIGEVVNGLIVRICVGLPGACASLNDDAAAEMLNHIIGVNSVIRVLQDDQHLSAWHDTLIQLADQSGLHGLMAGHCCRILLEANKFTREEAARRLSLALSNAGDPVQAAAWIEGFLKGSGLLLLHDESLLSILDDWVTTLPDERFTAILPLLRRTFTTFSSPERRKIGERLRQEGVALGKFGSKAHPDHADYDPARAEAVLPLIARLLGLEVKS